tara:strand:+ start:575 stop:2503 length:1929 start_codon:yes stop_codon:yes gene_type:complete
MTKKVNIDIVARDKTKRAVEQSKKGLGSIKTAALAVSTALAGIGAGRAISGLIQVGKEVESLRVRFKFLFGSAQEGNKAFDNLANFAAKVPFSLQEISAASGNLAVVSKDAKDLSRILEITGNVAAVTGLDFQTTASQIQRAFSGGIAAADVFREKGVRSLLGFEQGAKVSIDATIKRFEEVFGKGGKFGNATDELANTFEGTVSMLGDKFFKFQNDVNESFFTELKKQFGDLNQFLANNEDEIAEFGREIGEALASGVKLTANAVIFLSDNFDILKTVLKAIIAVQITKFLFAMAGAVSVVNGRMVILNATMKKNLIFFAAGALVFGIEKITKALGLLGDEVEDNTEKQHGYNDSLREFDRQLRDQKETIADAFKTEEIEEVTTATKDMTLAMSLFDEQLNQQKQSLASVDEEYLKIIQSLGLLNDAQIKTMNGFDAQKAASREAHNTEVQTAEEAAKKNLEAFKKGEFGKINMKKLTDKQLGQMGRAALQEGAKINKEMFRLNQALMIGEAIMNTAAGVTKALAQGGAFGIPMAIAIGAMGAIQIATIAAQQPPAQFGGSRQQGTPFLVGEKGAELFTPVTAGTVTPNHQLGDALGATHIVFNINTVDAKGFGALLDTRKAQIVNMINSARNQKGQSNIV